MSAQSGMREVSPTGGISRALRPTRRIEQPAQFGLTRWPQEDIEVNPGIDGNGTVAVTCLCGLKTTRIPVERVGIDFAPHHCNNTTKEKT